MELVVILVCRTLKLSCYHCMAYVEVCMSPKKYSSQVFRKKNQGEKKDMVICNNGGKKIQIWVICTNPNNERGEPTSSHRLN